MSDVVEKQFLRASEVVGLGLCGSIPSLYRWISEGNFPKPIKLMEGGPRGGGTSVFRKADIDAWLAEREAAS